jgi:F-type H+-transporting ATPase subunit a
MESLEHPLLIVDWVNALFAPLLGALGIHAAPGHDLIPNYLVMTGLIVLGFLALGLVVRSRLSVENPGRAQIILEDLVMALVNMLEDYMGSKGRAYLPLIGAFGGFILVANYIGLVPGFMAPTSNINVPVGCAVTAWVYYHLAGIRAKGLGGYLKHFVVHPGIPIGISLMMLPIEILSHLSRVLSLSLRLFGNVFGEELVILILGLMVPYFLPLPMMLLGLVTGGLQAYIFALLTTIYLQGAVLVEHEDDHEVHEHVPGVHEAPAHAAVIA